MYASKTIIFLLALLLAVASAHPLRHHHQRRSVHKNRRSMCRGRTSVAPSAAAATADLNAAVHVTSTGVSASDEVTSSSSPSPTASGSSSSSAPKPTNKASEGGAISALFPVGRSSKSWSTSPRADNALPLSDETLRPTHLMKSLSHDYVDAPDGKLAMKAHYAKGSFALGDNGNGGLSFYALGPSSVDLSQAKEATLGYSVFFEEGFAFAKGGKLPGLAGGDSDEDAVGCSGGSRSKKCFSARLMWRENGAGEFYTYLPPYTDPEFAANKKVCNVPPFSDCNPTYGASVGRGAFKFVTGGWTTVSERVRLNDAGEANGEIELFVGGESVIKVGGLILRDDDAGRIRNIQMQTFFGGSSEGFASPKDQNVYFSDFSLAITETF